MEQKKPLLIGGTLLVCLALLAVTARRAFYAYDAFWHLQTGLDWLALGLSPWRDHFSFTFEGAQISSPPWMFQSLLGMLVHAFGLDAGFQTFRFASYCLLIGLFVVFLRKLRAPIAAWLLVLPMVVVLLQFRVLVRPELLAYSFSIAALMLYYRARNGLTAANMLPILGLMLLWSNYHTSILGYVIFFGYFIDMALQHFREDAPGKTWIKWLAWGVAVVVVGFLKPGFNHALLGYLHFSSNWSEHITEYYDFKAYLGSAGFYVLVLIALITCALLVWKRRFGPLAVCLILTAGSSSMPRLITPGGIILLGIFAWILSEIDFEDKLKTLPAVGTKIIGAVVLGMFVISIGSGLHKARQLTEENEKVDNRYPWDVTNYMINHGISGRIFNEFAVGGYLIHRLSPESQVYIDGRTNILYPIEHLELFLEANQFPDVFRAEIEKYDIGLALLPNRLDPFSLVHDSDTLELDYVGRSFSLFRKDNPNFPILGKLIVQPSCWNQALHEALEEEWNRAQTLLSGDSMLLPYADYVVGYSRSVDKPAFLSEPSQSVHWDIPRLRFAGFQALDNGMNQLAQRLFSGFTKWEFRDYLASALASARLGQWERAEKILDKASRHAWPNMKSADLAILHELLVYIRENIPLNLFDEAYLIRLEQQLGYEAENLSPSVPQINSFCQVNW